jgi:hypothetical protein
MDVLGDPEANPCPELERSDGSQNKQNAMDQIESSK